jgi:hypothetical protein
MILGVPSSLLAEDPIKQFEKNVNEALLEWAKERDARLEQERREERARLEEEARRKEEQRKIERQIREKGEADVPPSWNQG